MTKKGVKVLSVAIAISIPLTYVLIKNNNHNEIQLPKENKNKTISTKVENGENHKTITFYENDARLYHRDDVCYLAKDNNYFLCIKKLASTVDLATMEVVQVTDSYYDVNNDRYLEVEDGYTIYTIEEFKSLAGTSLNKTRTLTMMP